MSEPIEFLTQRTIAKYGDDGFWEVISQIIAGHKGEDEDKYDTRTISVKSIDRDVQNAVNTAKMAVENRFKDLGYNLFNLPKEEDGKYFPDPLENLENS